MSNATVTVDARTAEILSRRQRDRRHGGKAIVDGQQIDLPDDQPSETVAMTASEREAIISEEVSADSPGPLKVRTVAELNREYEASLDDTAGKIGRFINATALSAYCEIGAACRDHLILAKRCYDAQAEQAKVASEWNKDRYDDECSKLSGRVRVLFPDVVAAESKTADDAQMNGKRKRDPIEVTLYVQAYLSVQALRDITGDAIDSLSYRLIRNYVMRTMVSLSKGDISVKIKDGWREFARVEIPRVASGQISVGQFIAQMDSHRDKLTSDSKSKDAASKVKASVKAINTLTDALASAIELAEPKDVAEVIAKLCREANVTLPGMAEPKAIDPAKVTHDELLDALRMMLILQRVNEVRAIVTACAEMATIIPALAPKPRLAETA